jgi:hypothetical protein
MLPRHSTLTAGDRRRRKWSVNPASPSLTTARDLGLEDAKAQGAVCKAKTHMNSAIGTPLCYRNINRQITQIEELQATITAKDKVIAQRDETIIHQ